MKRFSLLALATFFYVSVSAQCTDDRYRNFNYFPGSTATTDVEFGINESVPPFGSTQGSPQSLKMDVYEPEGDQTTDRPVVIVAFGGSFIGGSRGQVEFLCREFASLGYVAVAPDYRVGFFIPDEISTTLAVLRGAHDMKGCVRYLRKTVADDGNPYGINPDMIFVGGVSAGAISAIHAAYLDDIATEIPAYLVNDTAGLGGLEGNTGPLGFSSEVNGVFSYSGAIGDTTWMIQNDVPIISFHEEGDGTVPYLTEEVAVSGIATGLIASGSFDLHLRAENAGMDNCFTGYPGNGHVGFLGNDNYEEVLSKTADFLADIVCAETIDCGEVTYAADTSSNTAINQLDIIELKLYPNPASDFVIVDITAAEHDLNGWNLIDLQGRTVLEGSFASTLQRIEVSSLESGSYILKAWGKEALGEMPIVVQ
ncbi:MAG: para-nitrobenzyl esterase [Bacteroidia bacterium]|jgi:para-nitrobenzyl esterase